MKIVVTKSGKISRIIGFPDSIGYLLESVAVDLFLN